MFDINYTNYWEKSLQESIDGLKIADTSVLANYLGYLKPSKNHKILDHGCSFGRMFQLLSKYYSCIYGIDIDIGAINKAARHGYTCLNVACAENTTFPDKFFNSIISWGVFDVIKQEKGLIECNRILKKNGHLLFTVKNNDYLESDAYAFTAERNAKLKSFPHMFTDVKFLLENLHHFGFKLTKCFIAEKRGDMGKNLVSKFSTNKKFYEAIIILKKEVDINFDVNIIFTHEFSNVAKHKAIQNNFNDILKYFIFDKQEEIDYA